jgi:hypothetical protein
MQLSKNGSQAFPPQFSANIKGTVSGTFVPTWIAARSGFYASPRAYVNALSHPERFFKNPLAGKDFSKRARSRRNKAAVFRKARRP